MKKIISLILTLILLITTGVTTAFANVNNTDSATIQANLNEEIVALVEKELDQPKESLKKSNVTNNKAGVINKVYKGVKGVFNFFWNNKLSMITSYVFIKGVIALVSLAAANFVLASTIPLLTIQIENLQKNCKGNGFSILYDVMEVPKNHDCQTLKEAYKQGTFLYHPDKALGIEQKKYNAKIFSQLTEEYNIAKEFCKDNIAFN